MCNFKDVIENSSAGIVIIQDNEIRFINNAMCKLVGYDYVDLKAIDFLHDIVYDSDVCIFDQFYNAVDCNHSNDYTYRIVTKNHEIKYLRCIKSSVIWNDRPAIQLTNIDASDKIIKDIENKLIVNSVAENINIGLWRLDTDFNIIYANSYFCKVFEVDFAEIKGTKFTDLFYNIDDEALVANMIREETYEAEILLGDGVKKWVKITCNTIGHNVDNTGVVGTLVNITKDKIYLPELLQLREELKQEKRERIR